MGWNPIKSVQNAWHSATTAVSNAGSWIGSNVQNFAQKINPADIARDVAKNIDMSAIASSVQSAMKNVSINTSDIMGNVAKNVGGTFSSIAESDFMKKSVAIGLNAGVELLPAVGKVMLASGEGALAGLLTGGAMGSAVPILGNLVGAIGGAGAGAVGMGVKEIFSSGLPALKNVFNDSVQIVKADLNEDSSSFLPSPSVSQEEYDRLYQEEYNRLYQEEYNRQYNEALKKYKESEAKKIAEEKAKEKLSAPNSSVLPLALIAYFFLGGKK